uniref:Treslin STD domain-containing protein n=1 Tax=Plectus sambesii TaxID=2011161 RepID=A0A914V9J4_9BILA
KLTGTFLRKYALKTSDRLCEEYDQLTTVDQDKRLIEYETQILIELYALRFIDDIPLENSSIVNKFRFIYFTAEPGRMKTFLDETVADEFSTVMPNIMAQIYEELCVTIPCDLKEFAAEHDEQPVDSLFVENQKRMMANKHLQALDRVLQEDAAEEGRMKSSRLELSKKRKKAVVEERKKKKGSCRSLSFSKDEEGGKKSRLSVPE